MSFDHPLRFGVAIVAAALLVLLYLRVAARKTTHDLVYSNLAFFLAAARPRQWVPRALQAAFIVALAAFACAVGGVHLAAPVPVRDGAVFICIDTSGSMAATDIVPTRAAAALAAARAFIEESPPGTRIGIIAFSAGASMVQPLSSDRAAVENSLASVPPPNGGTAIGDALRLAASALPRRGHRLIVLITDGVNNMGVDPQQVSEWLGTQHVPVYTIGIGTPNGGIIPGSNDEATIDEGALQSYAEVSGGAYARAENATQLRDALARLGRITAFEKKKVDATAGFTVAGIVLLIGTFLGFFGIGKL
jgi:Ca-activated chloride channel family protein